MWLINSVYREIHMKTRKRPGSLPRLKSKCCARCLSANLITYFRQTRGWCDDGDVRLALMMAGREQTNVIQQEVMSEKVSTYITRKYITGTTDIQFSMDYRDWCLLEQSPFWDVFLKLLSESRSKNTQNFRQDLKALSESVARILHDDK